MFIVISKINIHESNILAFILRGILIGGFMFGVFIEGFYRTWMSLLVKKIELFFFRIYLISRYFVCFSFNFSSYVIIRRTTIYGSTIFAFRWCRI